MQPNVTDWRVVATSIQGTSHQKREQVCQDAHCWRLLPKKILVGAVADGAGSASLSEIGSQTAAQTAVDKIATQISLGLLPSNTEEAWQGFWLDILKSAQIAVETEAANHQVKLRELATTLILVVASPEWVAVAQVGDGAVVLKDSEGMLIGLATPPIEESLDLVTFLTSPNAFETVQFKLWQGMPAQIALLSDGLQILALKMPTGIPHEPFFLPLFRFVAKTTDESVATNELTEFLQSEQITDRADDDLTLLLATLGS